MAGRRPADRMVLAGEHAARLRPSHGERGARESAGRAAEHLQRHHEHVRRAGELRAAAVAQGVAAPGPSRARTDSGSTRASLMRTAQCSFAPVTRPVAPTRPTTWSADTASHSWTSIAASSAIYSK